MTSDTLKTDLDRVIALLDLVGRFLPSNALESDLLAFLKLIEADDNLLAFVVALINSVLPAAQPNPNPPIVVGDK